MIVGCLFVITLVSFLVYLFIFRNRLEPIVTTGFFSLLSGLIGFFVGSMKTD